MTEYCWFNRAVHEKNLLRDYRLILSLMLAGDLCKDQRPLNRFFRKLYGCIDCIFFRYYDQSHFY